MATSALDKNTFMKSHPEPLVQIQNNFIEIFLIIHSVKFD